MSALIHSGQATLARVDDETALTFWHQSPQSTPFNHPRVLGALSSRVDWWLARTGDGPAMLWPVAFRLDGVCDAPRFSYYVGPLSARALLDLPPRARVLAAANVVATLADALRAEYGEWHIELAPGVDDIRPYRWWARERGVDARLSITPQYTATLPLTADADVSTLTSTFSDRRRQAALRARRGGTLEKSSDWDTADVLRLYRALAERAGDLALYESRRDELTALVMLVRDGFGFAEAWQRNGSGGIVALRLVITAGARACDVLSLADDAERDAEQIAAMTVQTLAASAARGLAIHDFNGANSRERGSDVHSYGAEAALYFALDFAPR